MNLQNKFATMDFIEKYSIHLTRYVQENEERRLYDMADTFHRQRSIYFRKEDPPAAIQHNFTSYELYLLLDFFTTNGWLLRGYGRWPQKNVILADSHQVYAAWNENPFAPLDKSELALLSEWKGKYQYGFFDYGYTKAEDDDSQTKVTFTTRHLLILLDYFALYGSLVRYPDQTT